MTDQIHTADWFTQRWQKPTDKGIRYYDAYLHQDLWGGWVVTRVWGRRGTQLGGLAHTPCPSYPAALDELAAVRARREQRGYRISFANCKSLDLTKA